MNNLKPAALEQVCLLIIYLLFILFSFYILYLNFSVLSPKLCTQSSFRKPSRGRLMY